jgi:hypothetical protein
MLVNIQYALEVLQNLQRQISCQTGLEVADVFSDAYSPHPPCFELTEAQK